MSPALAGGFFTTEPQGSPENNLLTSHIRMGGPIHPMGWCIKKINVKNLCLNRREKGDFAEHKHRDM